MPRVLIGAYAKGTNRVAFFAALAAVHGVPSLHVSMKQETLTIV